MTKRRNGKGKAWGRFTAAKNGRSVHLTFTNEEVFWNAKFELEHTHKFEVTDAFFGFKLYETIEDAVEDARISCRDDDWHRERAAS